MQQIQQQSCCRLFPILAAQDEQPKQRLPHLRGWAALESLALHTAAAPRGLPCEPQLLGVMHRLQQRLLGARVPWIVLIWPDTHFSGGAINKDQEQEHC